MSVASSVPLALQAAVVPAKLAVSTERHVIAFAPNELVHALLSATPPALAAYLQKQSFQPKRVRFDHLPPPCLSSALFICRQTMKRVGYTVAISGDVHRIRSPPSNATSHRRGNASRQSTGAAPKEEEVNTDSAPHAAHPLLHAVNAVCVHMVQRRTGDFTPSNNVIYHRLLRDYALRSSLSPAVEVVGEPEERAVTMGVDRCGADALRDSDDNDDGPAWIRRQQLRRFAALHSPPSSTSKADGTNHQHGKHRESLILPPPPPQSSGENIDQLLPRVPTDLVGKAEHCTLQFNDKVPTTALPRDLSAPPRPDAAFYFFPYRGLVDVSIAHVTERFFVLVNLKPVVPGHLLLVPRRIVPSVHDFTVEEVWEWGVVLRLVLDVMAEEHPCAVDDGFSIGIQSGTVSGQTVWHQHTHIIPFAAGGPLAGEPEVGDEEEQARRCPRTADEMRTEAYRWRTLFQTRTSGRPSGNL